MRKHLIVAATQQKKLVRRPATLQCETVDDVVLAVHGASAPSIDDWNLFMKRLEQNCAHFERGMLLVYTPGPAPNAVQRAQIISLSAKYPLSIAICTESRMARGIMQALSWATHIRSKPFGENEWADACEYVGISEERGAFFAQLARRLRAELPE